MGTEGIFFYFSLTVSEVPLNFKVPISKEERMIIKGKFTIYSSANRLFLNMLEIDTKSKHDNHNEQFNSMAVRSTVPSPLHS